MANKTRDDYSEAELKKFHAELSRAATKADRAVIFKQINAVPQAVAQWFRHMELKPLGPVGSSTSQKRGRPAGSKNAPKAKPGRPKGTTTKAPKSAQQSASKSRNGISTEAKEMLIRLMDKLLSD